MKGQSLFMCNLMTDQVVLCCLRYGYVPYLSSSLHHNPSHPPHPLFPCLPPRIFPLPPQTPLPSYHWSTEMIICTKQQPTPPLRRERNRWREIDAEMRMTAREEYRDEIVQVWTFVRRQWPFLQNTGCFCRSDLWAVRYPRAVSFTPPLPHPVFPSPPPVLSFLCTLPCTRPLLSVASSAREHIHSSPESNRFNVMLFS